MQPAAHALIIGAGPAGCSCAVWLGLHGISSDLIEREAQPMALLQRLDLRQGWVLGQPDTTTSTLATHYLDHLRRHPEISFHCKQSAVQFTQISPQHKQLRLADQTVLTGSILIFATGLKPAASLPYLDAQGRSMVPNAIDLTMQRDQIQHQRVLLLGGGDNAVENAIYLAKRGNAVVLWARSGLRAQRRLQQELRAMQAAPGTSAEGQIELRIGQAMPSEVAQPDQQHWQVQSTAHGLESFTSVYALFGFTPEDGAWTQMMQSDAWRATGQPPYPIADHTQLQAFGVFVAGDVSQRLHPCIQTALADGVTAARQAVQSISANFHPAPMTAPNKSTQQSLSITGLHLQAQVGILPHERDAPQPIAVDAELNLGVQDLPPRDDEILHVLDYRKVRRIIIDECTAEHVNLLESLIGKVALRLMQLPGVVGVRVKITKLKIFDDCEVAIRIETGQW